MILAPPLTFRRINPQRDSALAYAAYRGACLCSFGDPRRCPPIERYLHWLRNRVDEFPEGHVLALLPDGRCVGQLELQVPYGASTGYVNLFYVSPPFRRQGFGLVMNEYAERYFKSWEATTAELHVSVTNARAIAFYRRVGYHSIEMEGTQRAVWLMRKTLKSAITLQRP